MIKRYIALVLAAGIVLSGCAADEPPAQSIPPTEANTSTVPITEPVISQSEPQVDWEELFSAAAAPESWAANCQDHINLRKESRFSESLAAIPAGGTFTLLQWQGTYARVSCEGKEGYVLTNYIKPAEDSYFPSVLSTVTPTESYSYHQLLQDLEALTAAYPDSTTRDSMGTSELGRDIPILLIGNPEAKHHVLLQGAIHAREHMTAWLLMALADFWLARDIASCGDICFHIIPMVNPDGVLIAQEGMLDSIQTQIYVRDTLQGFNTDDQAVYTAFWKANGLGIDLNRNFPTGWDTLEGRKEPSSQLYRGEAPFCAAETAALRDYTLRYPFAATVSYHASGSFIYYEYGNKTQVNLRSKDFAEAVSAVTGYPLRVSEGIDAGGYKDWAIDTLEIPSLTIEIGCERAPLAFAEIYSIFARNCVIFPAIAQWVLS